MVRVSKEILINLGNYSNIKIIAEVTSEGTLEEAWKEVNASILEQEKFEKELRLAPKPSSAPKKDDFDPNIF